jgi:hypothetical protein
VKGDTVTHMHRSEGPTSKPTRRFLASGIGLWWLHAMTGAQRLGSVCIMCMVAGCALIIKVVQVVYVREAEIEPLDEAYAVEHHPQSGTGITECDVPGEAVTTWQTQVLAWLLDEIQLWSKPGSCMSGQRNYASPYQYVRDACWSGPATRLFALSTSVLDDLQVKEHDGRELRPMGR